MEKDYSRMNPWREQENEENREKRGTGRCGKN